MLEMRWHGLGVLGWRRGFSLYAGRREARTKPDQIQMLTRTDMRIAEREVNLKSLIKRLEKADGPDRELDIAIYRFDRPFSPTKLSAAAQAASDLDRAPHFTRSIDAAMTLLPWSATNHDLFSFGGHGRKDIGERAWGFRFHDMEQLVGAERAKKQVARLRKDAGLFKLRGAPVKIMELAIAEQFMEFSGTHTPNPAIAICIAAVRARDAI